MRRESPTSHSLSDRKYVLDPIKNKHDGGMILDLKKLRIKNPDKLVTGQLHDNKFEMLTRQIQRNVDIIMISEKKLDNSLPTGQFLINSFKTPFYVDRNGHGVGVFYMLGKIYYRKYCLRKMEIIKLLL